MAGFFEVGELSPTGSIKPETHRLCRAPRPAAATAGSLYRWLNLIFHAACCGHHQMGFPKGASIPFGRLRG